MSVERSRKHGPFDLRYPPIRHKPAPASLWRLGEDRTDWEGFRGRFFPGCRRHDLDALAAYESYRNDLDGAVHVARSTMLSAAKARRRRRRLQRPSDGKVRAAPSRHAGGEHEGVSDLSERTRRTNPDNEHGLDPGPSPATVDFHGFLLVIFAARSVNSFR